MTIAQLSHDDAGTAYLHFSTVDLPVDAAIRDAGEQPTAAFFERLAVALASDVVAECVFRSRPDEFVAYGQPHRLKDLQRALEPVLTDPDRLREALRNESPDR